ncbi:RNA polymerase subunit sigma-70 [Enemella dayhoffiae]|uniref:RNA polymerase subunit sigma-70 n=1 Tax=Enemella dayhoffiae TaxID=2016507 RepID=A0A255GRL3_9ACTN|nr:sigma-70 family RNA polymerase sigma factor [Enemella dayhoffiae]OYO17246.1 RNA polymerase subunit sigma-70 [Enemella dayhoffiae]
MVDSDARAEQFDAERARLVRIATRVLGDPVEAEDIVQEAWLRLRRTPEPIDSLPAWLTTVTTRLCLDRLRARTPLPTEEPEPGPDQTTADPAEEVALAETVGIALQVVLDRLTPSERVAFVLHDSFGIGFDTIAAILGGTPVAARKLASRARAKVSVPDPADRADWEVVDAFLDAARRGEFGRLLELLAPDVVVFGDADAVAAGTPERIEGRDAVARFFNGAAKAALPTLLDGRAGAAWIHQGVTRVAFDFAVTDGHVQHIVFRADPQVLDRVERRRPVD